MSRTLTSAAGKDIAKHTVHDDVEGEGEATSGAEGGEGCTSCIGKREIDALMNEAFANSDSLAETNKVCFTYLSILIQETLEFRTTPALKTSKPLDSRNHQYHLILRITTFP
jgi:hypothetical protein